jgi:hypothetical protein
VGVRASDIHIEIEGWTAPLHNLPSIPTRVQAEHAIDAIIRLAEEYRGNGFNN